MNVKAVVPALPSFFVTESMLIRGSSSTIVATPCASPMIALPAVSPTVRRKVSFGFSGAIADHGHRDRLGGLAGCEGHGPGDRLIVAARHGACVGVASDTVIG